MEKAHDLVARVNIVDETVTFISEVNIHIEVQDACNQLHNCQWSTSKLRAQWLESNTRYTASIEGDVNISKTLTTIIRNLHKKQMHCKLSYITKGAHSGLDYTEVPTWEWYYSPKSDGLYHYSNGVFESHGANPESQIHFHKDHTLKDIPDTAFEVNII